MFVSSWLENHAFEDLSKQSRTVNCLSTYCFLPSGLPPPCIIPNELQQQLFLLLVFKVGKSCYFLSHLLPFFKCTRIHAPSHLANRTEYFVWNYLDAEEVAPVSSSPVTYSCSYVLWRGELVRWETEMNTTTCCMIWMKATQFHEREKSD